MISKTRCIECGSEDLKVLESREGVDGIGAYKFKCNDCEEEFGIFFDNGNVVEYFFD